MRVAADIDERRSQVDELERAQVDRDVRAERRQRIAESPLAFPAHGRSIRQYRQALYEFVKERWRRREAESHPLDRDIYPPENGKVLIAPLDAPPAWRDTLAGAPGVHQSERLSVLFSSVPTRTPVYLSPRRC